MSKTLKPSQSSDAVLQEIWRIKDTLSASCRHNVDRLFAEALEHQNNSGHPDVSLKPASLAQQR